MLIFQFESRKISSQNWLLQKKEIYLTFLSFKKKETDKKS